MISILRPTETVESILDIEFERLSALGKQALLFDFDGTLAERRSRVLPAVSDALLWELAAAGFRIGILTNRRSKRRIAELPFPIIYRAHKPLRAGYLAMLEMLASSSEQAVMIGDRYLTDMLGGNWLGMYTILVQTTCSGDAVP